MQNLKKEFTQSLYWNALDSLGTQALLIIHHILIRKYMGAEFHGTFGVMYSLFYLAIIIFNFGLDYALTPFYNYFFSNYKSVKKFITYYLLPQVTLIIFISILFLFFSKIFINFFQQITTSCDNLFNIYLIPNLILVFSISFISESLKKTFKTILQLGFYYKITALVEFLGMLIYMLLIWIPYFYIYENSNISLFYFWFIFLAVSVLQLLILFLYFIYSILKLPKQTDEFSSHNTNLSSLKEEDRASTPLALSEARRAESKGWSGNNIDINTRFLTNRFLVFLKQLGSQFFSSNFTVPLCAYYIGISQASFFKIITSLSYWITLVGYKVFGTSFNALLANLQTNSNATNFFYKINRLFYKVIFALTIFLIINGKKLVLLQISSQINTNYYWAVLYLVLFSSLAEGITILYEKWFIFQEKTLYLVFSQLISFFIFYFIIKYTNLISSVFALLSILILLRLLFFIILNIYSYYKWQIKPDFKIFSLNYIAWTVLLSSIFYLLI